VTADEIAKIIQQILAPVVMVTACSITLGGLFGHYQAINDRLRAMAREQLDLLRSESDQVSRERLAEIDHQAPALLRRHLLMRNALLAIEVAVVLFVACMLAIAAASIAVSAVLAMGVLGLFLLGTLMLLVGVVLSAIEVGVSHGALHYEVQRVLDLQRDVQAQRSPTVNPSGKGSSASSTY
jgi:hypothetical protein